MAYTTIDDSSAYFTTTIWTGDGTTPETITNDAHAGNFQADMLWSKGRNEAYEHQLYDSTRGAGTDKGLTPDTSDVEGQYSATYGYLSAFTSNGFTGTAGTSGQIAYFNANAKTYVAWQWKANGGSTTAVSESGSGNGGINACTHQANDTAGFSIIKYTGHRGAGIGDNNHTNVTHGLSTAPTFVIIKNLSIVSHWIVLGAELAEYSGAFANRHVKLNDNSARDGGDYVSNVAPDSNYVYVGNNNEVNGDGNSLIMYAWHEVQGFSKFGIYKGNGAIPNGTFIYTGFKPAFVLIKNIDAVESWIMYDTTRDTFNLTNTKLSPDQGNAENAASGIGDAGYNNIDIYSNGFKCKSNSAAANGASKTILYMAFAEEPFVSSGGVPATAR